MNLNLDLSVVTRFLRGMLDELRQKRLWPVAGLLLAGIVAVPVVLTKSATPAPAPQTPLPAPPPAAGTLATLNVQSTPAHSHLGGRARDPFGAAAGSGGSSSSTISAGGAGNAVASVATAAHNAVNALTGASSTGTGSSTASSGGTTSFGGGSTTGSSSNPPSITGNSKPKPTQSGLSSTESYQVALSISNSSGGVDAVDPLKRLSLLPGANQPLLVELGVLQGGNRVLFVVQPGSVVNGPGTCMPGPVDCEILSLGQDQTESVSDSSGGATTLFAVTGISAVNDGSKAAADKARQAASAAGRTVLANSSLPALSLFQYDANLGSVVDLRNLKVGG
jgi:hypothetical protein